MILHTYNDSKAASYMLDFSSSYAYIYLKIESCLLTFDGHSVAIQHEKKNFTVALFTNFEK